VDEPRQGRAVVTIDKREGDLSYNLVNIGILPDPSG
jgi:hypothetical protein